MPRKGAKPVALGRVPDELAFADDVELPDAKRRRLDPSGASASGEPLHKGGSSTSAGPSSSSTSAGPSSSTTTTTTGSVLPAGSGSDSILPSPALADLACAAEAADELSVEAESKLAEFSEKTQASQNNCPELPEAESAFQQKAREESLPAAGLQTTLDLRAESLQEHLGRAKHQNENAWVQELKFYHGIRNANHDFPSWLQPEKIRDSAGRSPDDPEYDQSTLWIPETAERKAEGAGTPMLLQYWPIKAKNFDRICLYYSFGENFLRREVFLRKQIRE